VASFLADNSDWCKPGEASLLAMTKQLQMFDIYKDDIHSYLADGIIKLYGLKKLKVLLLETSNKFGCMEKPKISFDHHKGLFGFLAMLKAIADEFPFASMKTFYQCKVIFIHVSGKINSFTYLFSSVFLSYIINQRKLFANVEPPF
jgi:hypothetical protein